MYIEGRDNGVVGSQGNRVTTFLEANGYTKVIDHCCGNQKLDHVYVRNDVRNFPLFKLDGKPRLMRDLNRTLVEL